MCPLHLTALLRGPQIPDPVPASPVLTETMEEHVPLPDTLLNLDKLQRHSRSDLEGQGGSQSFFRSGLLEEVTSGTGLTSVSLTALCWARMLPRPAMA